MNTDMVGKRYNHWTVLAECPERGASGSRRYLCRCDCGREKVLYGYHVRSGNSRQCQNCALLEMRARRHAKKEAATLLPKPSEDKVLTICTSGGAPRQYLIANREARGLSIAEMARTLKISPLLLGWLEENDKAVTHPKIVDRIADAYGLTEEQRVNMLPENYRPGPGYDPNRYALPEEVLSNFTVMPGYVRVWK